MEIFSYQPAYRYNTPVNFTAMKKSQFKGLDFGIVEKLKAPIETFDTHKDFEEWAKKKFIKMCHTDYGGRNMNTYYKRMEMIENWKNELMWNRKISYPERYLIMKGITKDLKPNDETICPVYNKRVLEETLNWLRENVDQSRYQPFDFGGMYKRNLRKMYLEGSHIDSNTTKWIVIPSQKHDPEHFEENIERLQTLSCHEWCTKNGGARMYLEDGDIHLYIEKGEPKVAVRFDDDMIKEINGVQNDFVIPKEYLDLTESYINENDFIWSKRVERDLKNSRWLAGRSDVAEPNLPKEEEVVNKTRSFSDILKSFFGIK